MGENSIFSTINHLVSFCKSLVYSDKPTEDKLITSKIVPRRGNKVMTLEWDKG